MPSRSNSFAPGELLEGPGPYALLPVPKTRAIKIQLDAPTVRILHTSPVVEFGGSIAGSMDEVEPLTRRISNAESHPLAKNGMSPAV
jgi:hypothetical protein